MQSEHCPTDCLILQLNHKDHELLYFFVPIHGKLGKNLMRVHVGNYEKTKSNVQTISS
jgi:hypothetical protein